MIQFTPKNRNKIRFVEETNNKPTILIQKLGENDEGQSLLDNDN